MNRIYLDYNATAPIRPAVQRSGASLGAGQSFRRACRRAPCPCRGRTGARAVADFAGAHRKGLCLPPAAPKRAIWPLVCAPHRLARLNGSGFRHRTRRRQQAAAASGLALKICRSMHGVIDMAALDSALSIPALALVCVMVANNETGVLQPICEIAERVRAHGSLLFCDGVQAAGKIPLSLEDLGCDALAVSAHKIGGPMGVGAFVVRAGLVVPPSIAGGGQELGRAVVENVSGIVGFGLAAELSAGELALGAALAANATAWPICARPYRMSAFSGQMRPDCQIQAVSGLPVCTAKLS